MFLNQNKEKSKAHRIQIEKLKKSLKELREALDLYTEKYNVAQKFSECHGILSKSLDKGSQLIENKVSVGIGTDSKEHQEFVYLTPNQLHHSNLDMQENQIKIALGVLEKYKEAAEKQISMLQEQIEKLENIVASPYIKDKERPYELHAILIHDGLAENGHYYSYIYDRVKKCWWQYNDHRTFQVEEEQVMKEAIGDTAAYKSACNLVYISPHVSKQIDQLEFPQYARETAQRFNIPKEILVSIEEKNHKFKLEQQAFVIEQQQ